MSYISEYQKWQSFRDLNNEIRKELDGIKDDSTEIKKRFSMPLSFGTAGLRGIMFAGISGMNIYTVAQATQGLAHLVKKSGGEKRGVVIACDTRNNSGLFSKISAQVLAANGIKVYIFDAPRPTPELSFALRTLGAIAGINITASHNPKQYNGYKVYWEDGAQLPPDHAKVVSDEISKTDIFNDVKSCDYEKAVSNGIITVIGKEIDENYISVVLDTRISKDAIPNAAETLKIVYTPLHGTGAKLVPEVLSRAGLKNLYCVTEQMIPNGDFPTVKYPNPEEKDCFALAIEIAEKNNCDLLIGTDPDADRVGAFVKTKDGSYISISGNQMGAMLLDYIIQGRKREGKLPANSCVVKSIVSTELATKICKKNNVTIMNVLTGFKFIGEKIKEFEKSGEYTYIFGFEESYGYLPGTYARDKDAVSASLLIVEMAAYYERFGMNLYDVLQSLYSKYGYYCEEVDNLVMAGLDGLEKTKKLMKALSENPPENIANTPVTSFSDYSKGITKSGGTETKITLPKSEVLYFILSDGSTIVVRPSGTEPKVKIYYMVNGTDKAEVDIRIKAYKAAMKEIADIK